MFWEEENNWIGQSCPYLMQASTTDMGMDFFWYVPLSQCRSLTLTELTNKDPDPGLICAFYIHTKQTKT